MDTELMNSNCTVPFFNDYACNWSFQVNFSLANSLQMSLGFMHAPLIKSLWDLEVYI